MKNLIFFTIILSFSFAQELARTDDGRVVILNKDGTWVYANQGESSSVNQKKNNQVFITRTGSKYHRSTCRYLKKSRIPTTLKNAFDRGYLACSICKPPSTLQKTKLSEELLREILQNMGNSKAVSVTCLATTQKGTRCSRKPQPGINFCWQH